MYTSIWPKERLTWSERSLQVFVGALILMIEFFVVGPILLGKSKTGVLVGTAIFGTMTVAGIVTLAALPSLGTCFLLYSLLGSLAVLLGMSYAK